MQIPPEVLADIEHALGVQKLQPNSWLDRPQSVRALNALGYPIALATLETRASRPTKDGSPPYRKFNRRVQYKLSDLIEWAADRVVYRTGRPGRQHR
jgi:hypothetical protein